MILSNYTYTVHELQENGFDFGLNDYEIFSEEYRPFLNSAILEHYKFYEIGYNNAWRWRDRLRERMNLIMRTKFNALYEARKIDFSPLENVNIVETYTRDVGTTNENKQTISGTTNVEQTNAETTGSTTEQNNTIDSTTTKNDSQVVNNTEEHIIMNTTSQYPTQAMAEGDLSGNIYMDAMNKSTDRSTNTNDTEIENSEVNKTTNENKTTQTGTTSATTTGTNTTNDTVTGTATDKTEETYSKTLKGANGMNFTDAILQYKSMIEQYDLDVQVINSLKDLFITIWGDNYE